MGLVGYRLNQLDTPVLWVDLDIMEANIRQLAGFMHEAGVGWRPHTKGIKIPAIAQLLLQAGAIGITCSKLGEAEVMAAAGIRDILIANQVVGPDKLARLVQLRQQADVIVAVDSLQNAKDISEAAAAQGIKIRAVIELNIGMDRCGIKPGPGVVDFARRLQELPGIELAGLMAWEGHVVKIEDPVEKRQVTETAIVSLTRSAELCREAGIPIPIVSCGGTGSYRISARVPGVTEIQAGGGIFGDLTYRRWGGGTDCGLFILTTVSSCPAPQRAIVDAGRKCMNIEMTVPQVKELSGAALTHVSAEHGILTLDPGSPPLAVGQKLNLVVGYEDWTVFLHDRLVGVRQGVVEVVWDILGRGKLS